MSFPRSFLGRREEMSWMGGAVKGEQWQIVAQELSALTDTCENARYFVCCPKN